jgi:menaquinone-dependent protoporphyrinogen IX oxidase
MSSDAKDNSLLDGIAELMLFPIQTGQTKKVEAQIIVELDDKDGKVKLSASINSASEDK